MEAGGQMFKWSGYRGYWEPRPPRQPSSFFTWNFFKSQRLLRCETCELDVQILMSFENLLMEEFSSGYAWKLRNYWEPRPPGARTTTEHFHLNPTTFWDIFSNLVQEGILRTKTTETTTKLCAGQNSSLSTSLHHYTGCFFLTSPP